MQTKSQLRNAALILDDDLVTVKGFFLDKNENRSSLYTWVATRDVAKALVKDDPMIVGMPNDAVGMAVVDTVDNFVDVDMHSTIYHGLVLGTINREALTAFDEKIDKLVDLLYEKQRENAQEQVLRTLGLTKQDMTVAVIEQSERDE